MWQFTYLSHPLRAGGNSSHARAVFQLVSGDPPSPRVATTTHSLPTDHPYLPLPSHTTSSRHPPPPSSLPLPPPPPPPGFGPRAAGGSQLGAGDVLGGYGLGGDLLGLGSDVSSTPRQHDADVAQWVMTGASGHAPAAHVAPPQVAPSAQGGSRLGRTDLAGSARVEGQVTGDDITRLLA